MNPVIFAPGAKGVCTEKNAVTLALTGGVDMSESWIVRILRSLAHRVVIVSGALLTLVVGIGPPVYNMMSGPSAQAIEADDKLAALIPAMDAHRRESDLLRMRARRVANALMRGAPVDDVQNRYDEFSLAVGDYQTTSNDLEGIMKTGFALPEACEGQRTTPCMALDVALRNVLNASARVETCLERGMKNYDANAASYMARLVSATDPDQEIADSDQNLEPTPSSGLNCRARAGHEPMVDRLTDIDACTSAIRTSLVSVRATLSRSRRENAWQRTFIDLRTALRRSASKDSTVPKKGDQLAEARAPQETAFFALGDDWYRHNAWVARDCSETELNAAVDPPNGQGRPPWELRPARPSEPPVETPSEPNPEAPAVS